MEKSLHTPVMLQRAPVPRTMHEPVFRKGKRKPNRKSKLAAAFRSPVKIKRAGYARVNIFTKSVEKFRKLKACFF